MFEAGGFGVAVTVAQAQPFDPDRWGPPPAGVTRRRSRLTDVLDPAGFTDAGLAAELASIADVRAQLAAYEAGVVAELAARRPAAWDLTEEHPGHRVEGWSPDRVPASVSEFFADELALVAHISPTAATVVAERSLALVHELTATWAALADGLIDPARAHAIVRALAGQSVDAGGPVDPGIVGEVEPRRWAGRWRGRPRCGCGSAPRRR